MRQDPSSLAVWPAVSALAAALLGLAIATGAARAQTAPPPAEATPPAAAATAARGGSDEAFQGLPWGASEAQVAERYAGRIQSQPCETAPRRAGGAASAATNPAGGADPAEEACGGLQVTRYVVAGIPFTLNFHFDAAERRLVRVSLTHQPAEAALDDTRWSEQHRALRRLLSQRYGSPESTDVNNDSTAYTAYARWRRGTTVIELQSLLVRRASSRPAHEQVQVVYSSVLHGEAGKL